MRELKNVVQEYQDSGEEGDRLCDRRHTPGFRFWGIEEGAVCPEARQARFNDIDAIVLSQAPVWLLRLLPRGRRRHVTSGSGAAPSEVTWMAENGGGGCGSGRHASGTDLLLNFDLFGWV